MAAWRPLSGTSKGDGRRRGSYSVSALASDLRAA